MQTASVPNVKLSFLNKPKKHSRSSKSNVITMQLLLSASKERWKSRPKRKLRVSQAILTTKILQLDGAEALKSQKRQQQLQNSTREQPKETKDGSLKTITISSKENK